MGIVLLLGVLGFLALAGKKKVYPDDPGGLTRLASDGLHNQWTHKGKIMAYEYLEQRAVGVSPPWFTPTVGGPAVWTLPIHEYGQLTANQVIKSFFDQAPPEQKIYVWTDATFTELAMTDSADPPLKDLSAKFNLLTSREEGWPPIF